MAASLTSFHPVNIPGLGGPLTKGHLSDANMRYNNLCHVGSHPKEPGAEILAHIRALFDIIVEHRMGARFGIHSVHRHNLLPSDTVRLERADLAFKGGSWTRAAAISEVDPSNVFGTLFKLDGKNLEPYEFAVGESPVKASDGTTTNVPAKFLAEVAAYLDEHGLAEHFGLEVKSAGENDGRCDQSKIELEVQWGGGDDAESFTVVLPSAVRAGGALAVGVLTPTGWDKSPGDPDPVQPGTHYEKIVVGPKKETHKVIITGGDSSSSSGDSAALPPASPLVVFQELAQLGFVA